MYVAGPVGTLLVQQWLWVQSCLAYTDAVYVGLLEARWFLKLSGSTFNVHQNIQLMYTTIPGFGVEYCMYQNLQVISRRIIAKTPSARALSYWTDMKKS